MCSLFFLSSHSELDKSPCNPGVAGSIPGFPSLLDETLNPFAVDETLNTNFLKEPSRDLLFGHRHKKTR